MTAPLSTQRLQRQSSNLLVLLPGAYMTASDFVAHGFFDAVEARNLDLDLCAVDLDLEAISSGQGLLAVHEQLLRPARQHYRRVWLGGISLGGLLSLMQAADQPASIDGLCLIAPYPGSRLTTNAIARAGGLPVWEATVEQLGDPEFRVWRWLKSPPATLPVFAGHGRDDRFAEGMQQIADCFPPAARRIVDGDHDWPAWRQLWAHFLDLGHFPVRA
ncbi:MAG: hypothetical protein L6Q40_02415 [Azonexus sp.]|nr:hypothetical protein [Azonexus sp.]